MKLMGTSRGSARQSPSGLDVVRMWRERVALRQAALFADIFVAAGKADRLEAQEADGLGVVEGELDDAATCVVVDAVMMVVTGTISHTGARAGLLMACNFTSKRCAHCGASWQRCRCRESGGTHSAGRLPPRPAQSSCSGEFNAVESSLDAVVTHLAASRRWRQGSKARGSAHRGELHAHLAPRSACGVVEHGLDSPRSVRGRSATCGIEEAGDRNSSCAGGQIDGQHRAAPRGSGWEVP